ncbi:hypothetical protein G6N82_09765 [Altererythrobacter sp. BO-6]|nr:hypothetical protein G6N82_09765 [Altererythrobacter sp. BO-6]
MNLPPEILQFVGSLLAILLLAWLAHALRLGGKPALDSEAAIRRAADEAVDGYEPTAWSVDMSGKSAIMCDANGRLLLLRQHGNKLAGRILGPDATARIAPSTLRIDSGERRFGSVELKLDDAQAWAEAVNALGSHSNA